MAIVAALGIFVVLVGIVVVFGYAHYVKPSRFLDQLAVREVVVAPIERPAATAEFSLASLLEPIGKLLPVSAQDAAVWKDKLTAAGIRSSSALGVLYGAKLVLAMVLGLAALLLRDHLFSEGLLRIFAPFIAGAAGYVLPGMILARLVKRRRTAIRLSLADVLDLLVVCTEAGCGLDQALVNVARELKEVHPAIAEELTIVNMEMMAGKSRADALRNLGRRSGEDELKKLAALLVQTDRFGTSISEALRTQSDFMRVRRRQEAEERAGKVGVKLVFPIFFCCLPSLLVVTAGSGLLQLFRNLLPIMNGAGH
ncbi:MAG: type II secretion system F family protein [Candidatus Acidiferrales bacterium]